ncbi:MAG: PaaI family thioesterase, partial [Pseudomonas sp.]|nr:PaaI family thioesterase [Pseudomonas sp.]
MIPADIRQQLNRAHARGDYQPLLALIPYAGLIGIECERHGDDLLFRLPANPDNIGNPLLPAIHGGVIAGFMELSAALYLLIFSESASIPKI